MKNYVYVLLLALIVLLIVPSCSQVENPWNKKSDSGDNGGNGGSGDSGDEGDGAVSWAGIRVSSYGMEDAYGDDNFPNVTKMMKFADKMQGNFSGSTGAFIWIVGTVSESNWSCRLEFPLSKEISHVSGIKWDKAESYLTACDKAGYSVWLQVEPGDADLVELATEVMSHYKDHPCVKGFGIDVEWYKPEGTDGEGSPLTATEANKVLKAVRKINPNYTVFVKHWDEDFLPPAKNGFIYVNDSQGFKAWKDNTALENMRNEFSYWAETFAPCPVMFQIGYRADRPIWKTFKDPAKELGQYLADGCSSGNDIGIIWVDFTLNEVL